MGTLNVLCQVGTALLSRVDMVAVIPENKRSGKMCDSSHFLGCKRDFIVPTRLKGQQQQNYIFFLIFCSVHPLIWSKIALGFVRHNLTFIITQMIMGSH